MHPETEHNNNAQAASASSPRAQSHSYPFPLDAIVLAGTHTNPKRLITGRNKAFLKVGGAPLI
ncbi:MAG: hypothetical protein R3311_22360, partial [Oceanisphaera sp.]|nr:hypothetical protein [Oceanisphaera sp.]